MMARKAKRKKTSPTSRRQGGAVPRVRTPPPQVGCEYLEEPALLFGAEREHVFTRTGLAIFGPRTLDQPKRHPSEIRVGVVGSGESVDVAKSWIESCLDGVKGDTPWDDFPGFRDDRGFFSRLHFDDAWTETITQHELEEVANLHLLKDRFT